VKKNTSFVQLVTAEGEFNLQTSQPGSSVKINESEIPTTINLTGTLTMLGPENGRLKLFLGRTIPYVTGTFSGNSGGKPSSSYQQMSVGLNSTFVIALDKPLIIQSDGNGDVTISVKRQAK